jgi:LysM repeat protein
MSQTMVYTLLLFALALPVLGGVLLRVLIPRLSQAQLYGGAALIFGLAIVSVLLLARGDIPSLQVGRLSILLPVTAPDDSSIVLAPSDQDATVAPQEPTTATAVLSSTAALPATAPPTPTTIATPTATATVAPPTAAPTEAPTPTPEPTAVPPTAVPPTETPAPPSEQRKYIVQPGDTLLSIARKFNTTVPALVRANKLTPEEADALRIGQELVIP